MSIEKFLIGKGAVKTKQGANTIMALIICICLLIIFALRTSQKDDNRFDTSDLSAHEKEFLGLPTF